jgi:uncharacterized protein YfiM (DUF2279 family)
MKLLWSNWSTILFLLLTISVKANKKDSTFFQSSTSFSKKRMALVGASEIGIAAAADIGVWNFWYKKQKTTTLHTFDDAKEWGGMDKLGHAFTANKITGFSTKLAHWSGCKPWKARAYGFGVAFAYQTSVELMDGFSQDYGFSWTDILANTSGSTLYVVQDWIWQEQRVLLKLTYSPSKYAAFRPNILGSTFSERLFKDYNGQTYWISANIKSFLTPESKFPKWINVAVGHGMDQKLFGFENHALLIKNGETYIFNARHQWYLSLDIDFSRIKTNKIWLKKVLTALNLIKIPFPALRLQSGKLGFSLSSF